MTLRVDLFLENPTIQLHESKKTTLVHFHFCLIGFGYL